ISTEVTISTPTKLKTTSFADFAKGAVIATVFVSALMDAIEQAEIPAELLLVQLLTWFRVPPTASVGVCPEMGFPYASLNVTVTVDVLVRLALTGVVALIVEFELSTAPAKKV